MERDEIMVGDAVRQKGYPYILHISEIRKDCAMVRESFGDGRVWEQESSIEYSDMEPVRLNHTILSKVLTYENETEDGRYYSVDDSRVWGILDKGKFYLCFNGQQDMICIMYLHELQHALRLCGLTDLADGFMPTK